MREPSNKYLISALLIGVIFHGSAIFFTLENTYDALIHLFFGNHYAQNWFEPWDYSWYTGFNVMSYPPLVHQCIGLLSYIVGLKFSLFLIAIIGVILFITGIYRFSLLLSNNRFVAGYASIITVVSSSFVEALHIFGQLPSIIGISILMHSLPEIYLFIRKGYIKHYFNALSLLAVTVCSHHVTPIFGMVFFIAPLIGMAIIDKARESTHSFEEVRIQLFLKTLVKLLKRIIVFGFSVIVLIVVCILPYWINSKKNPITQVPIPHGSRDNFIEVTSSGLVFFVIPWGILLFVLPYVFYRLYSKRYIFFGLSLAMLTLLGTGGTTPLPIKILGSNAFNILTLDRFTFWASIMSLPMFGEFVYRLIEGDLKKVIQKKYGSIYHKFIIGLYAGGIIFLAIFTITLTYCRPLQPKKIDMQPIVNFLNQDQHDQWRFLPLGFGDQMAYLSTLTKAMTVDGNYHSARRLPELTSRAVERLENCKFRGLEGIGSLQQFLTVPEKYNLKYIFSNDKFYDPILYYCGWHRIGLLENGIMVWEKISVKPLSKIIPKDDIPNYLKLMWGIIPLFTIIVAFVLNIQMIWVQALKTNNKSLTNFKEYGLSYNIFNQKLIKVLHYWGILLSCIIIASLYLFYRDVDKQLSPENVVKSYYNDLDHKDFRGAYKLTFPKKEYPFSQFMLEISVRDGIINSYAKLDSIAVEIAFVGSKKAKVIANTKWVTPLKMIYKTFTHFVNKKNGKWYIVPEKKDIDIPPDELLSNNQTEFYKQGRRRITTQQTYHEDVLRQPDLEIISASLVEKNNRFEIIGTLQNIDNVPADVILKADLYDRNNTMVASFNSKYTIKHKLNPKETTPFKIEFEEIAWLKNSDIKPTNFNPDEFSPKFFKSRPVRFNLHGEGNVVTTDLYNSVSLNELEIKEGKIKGNLFNFGTQEVTISELIISYYNDKKDLIYVDHYFINEGIRIQRKQDFDYTLLDLNNLKIINSSIKNCFINGISNESIARSVFEKNNGNELNQLQKIEGKGFSFIKINFNNFIGNPRL
ncbi:hypothetical protein AX766_05320 [Flavobacterium covae]|uniref:hypothetical protein n=1 Tax=Flavobacterium TaxID=237 RepID=UPI0007C1CDD8|nr:MULTISPECIES: hypothetical protein [Flavobacterium]AND63877.1 hypothetical protein AX766_05320 [Flavobacterium covae]MCJ1806529.1 hypothetical protein [Flavobacterium covae]OXA83207.1 hypothetical protein B0A56_02165 [Flavobacterium columnare NBRC 100251 = ATCC 23463]